MTQVARTIVFYDAGVMAVAWQQVGRYMFAFGMLEQALGDIVAKILDLNDDAARLLRPRLFFSAKVQLIEKLDSTAGTTHRLEEQCFGSNREVPKIHW